ncbi:MAG: hypothetical protein IPL65_17240 [Lewinellaceae bacterium]|nr:hypothetical protein [Lewinellaceae bacterium]
MRTLSFFLLFTCLSSTSLLAQNSPENPEPGACYVRCAIEEITEMAKVITTPTYKEYKVVPAEYKTVTEQVLVKEASKRFEYVPAVYREVIDTIMVLEPESQYSIHPVKTIDTIEVFEVEPAFSRFESRPSLDGCDSPNPGDCDVICYVTYPAVTKIIPIKKIGAWPYYEPATPKPAKYKYVKRQVVQTPATVREIDIPAEYVTVQKQVLVQDAHVDSTEIKLIARAEVLLVSVRGNNFARQRYEWRRIQSELLDYNLLPIHYNVNSTALTSEAKKVIDENCSNCCWQDRNYG